MVLQVLKGMSEFWEPVSYESRIISGFPESGHCYEDTYVETSPAHTVAVQQNHNHLSLAGKTPLLA